MKSLKKTLVLLVVLSMILSAVSPVFAFSDVIAEDYAEQANKMAAFGVFAGDANGNFNADAEITRAEMAVIIGKLMGLTETEANANKVYASAFSDVAAGEWYTGWINLAAGRGIISGFPDGTFRPNEKVTQSQAVTMIVKALGWGVVVDQTGTWPANYITKAAELRLFKDAVDTNSELVTRGNVAIYCYNALTAKTWDVTESTDGKLTSSKTSDTILAKYFSDFVNEKGGMKLVENATVTMTGATTTTIGANQIKIEATGLEYGDSHVGIATFIEAEPAPRKRYEEATYCEGNKTGYVIAYVPTEVANIASLLNKNVDVIFGEDNVVAYLAVRDDVKGNALVTAYNATKHEIEIDGVTYDIASGVTVSVFGYEIGGESQIAEVLTTKLGISNPKKDMTRNVIAEITLNSKDEVATINFIFSAAKDFTDVKSNTVSVAEMLVEKVSNKNVLTHVDGKFDLEELEDVDNPRVIRNGEIATLYDIEAGDVLTQVSYKIGAADAKVIVIFATANTVEGEVTDLLDNRYEIDGENYVAIAKPHYNSEGKTDEFTTAKDADAVYTEFEEEDVTAYLNLTGEVVAMVGEAEATGTVLGIVTKDAEDDYDSDDVEFLKVKILTQDGSNRYYKIYNKKSGKNISDAKYNEKAQVKADKAIVKGDFVASKTTPVLVRFEADADRVIKSDKIEIVATGKTYDFKGNDEVVALEADSLTIDKDDKLINSDKRFTSSTIVMNVQEEELITSWDALTNKDGSDKLATTVTGSKVWLFTKGTKVIYVVVAVAETNYGASDAQYGILLDVNKDKDEDGDTIYVATVLVDGKEETFECESSVRTIEEGTVVSFRVTGNEFKEDPTDLINPELVDHVADSKNDDAAIGLDKYLDLAALKKLEEPEIYTDKTTFKAIKVDSVEVVDGDTYVVFESTESVDLAEDYIVYSLEESAEIEGIEEGDYILVLDYDKTDKDYSVVVVL